MRAETRREHPFLIWAPFDAPARKWTYGEFHERVGALAAGLARRGVKPGEFVLIHLDNCIEAMLAWFACVELGAIAVTTNTRSAGAELEYFAGHCGAVAAITQPAYAGMIAAHCKGLRWLSVIAHDAGTVPASGSVRDAATVSRTVRRQRRPAAPRDRSAGPVQRAIYFRHHVAAEGGVVDACQCAVGRQGQRRAPGPARG